MSVTLTRGLAGAGVNYSVTTTHTGDQTISGEVTVPVSTTDQLLTISLDVSELKAYIFWADNTLTVETNTIGGVDTLNLVAGQPLIWESTSSYYTNLLATDVTAMYLTNASGSNTVTLKYLIEHDTTP